MCVRSVAKNIVKNFMVNAFYLIDCLNLILDKN